MTVDVLEWSFLAPALPPALRDTWPDMPSQIPWRAGIADAPDGDDLGPTADDEQLVTALGHALLEVLTGRRPTTQLARWIAPDSLDRLTATIRMGQWTQAQLRSARVSRTGSDGVLGRLSFECDGRPLVGCVRIQVRDNRWRCTHFALMLPGSQMRTED